MKSMEKYRRFLKAFWWSERDKVKTDLQKGIPAPPLEKPISPGLALVDLIAPEGFHVREKTVFEAIMNRISHRKFTREILSLEELSFLLWSTQGVHGIDESGRTKRTVPSAGSGHPFETYLLVQRVAGLEPGIYRYLPLEHRLCCISKGLIPKNTIIEGFRKQAFIAESAVVFVWTVIPYRSEWRYLMVAPKMMALDAGHMCQNLYLACESIGAGTCAIGMYDQELLDALVRVDGKEEFVIYAAPVGKVG
jgi:SagB-type dehydrogenase family enzyme